MRARFITPLVACICLTVDILSKNWARSQLVAGGTVPFIPGILRFTLTSNTGAAFSLGAGNALFMTALALTMTAAITLWIVKREGSSDPPNDLERIAMGCVLGGAIGNLVDRFMQGRVTDFLEFAFISFPIFNVADSLIDIGIGLVIISAFTQARRSRQARPPQPETRSQTDSDSANTVEGSE